MLCFGQIILVETILQRISSSSISASSGGVGYSVFLDCVFFLFCFMFPLELSMEGIICIIGSTIMLVHIAKQLFLVVCNRVCMIGINRVARYHFDIFYLVFSERTLISFVIGGICQLYGVLVRLTCHMPDITQRFLSINVWPLLS